MPFQHTLLRIGPYAAAYAQRVARGQIYLRLQPSIAQSRSPIVIIKGIDRFSLTIYTPTSPRATNSPFPTCQGYYRSFCSNSSSYSAITMPETPKGAKSGPQPNKSEGITIVEDGVEKDYTAITEGKATILFPGGGEVFYNPIQNFNRDLSVLAIRTFGEQYLREREEGRRKKAEVWKGKREKKRKRKDAEHEGKGRQGEIILGEGVEVEGDMVKQEQEGEEKESGNSAWDIAGNEDAGQDTMDIDPPGTTTTTTASEESKPIHPPFRILDALSATGLRALRYAQEITFATSLTANDLSSSAVASINRNITYNASSNPEAMSKITATIGSAQAHMYINPHTYHVIDLDPYGTASPFLDASLQAIVTKDSGPGNAGAEAHGGGLLCVTCTDAGVWASTGYSEKCFALYGGQPIKGDASHEAGLRLILYSIATTAAKYGLAIEPLLSLSIDFYARVFVRVKKSASEVKNLASKSMLMYNCDSGCGAWRIVPLGRSKKEEGRKGEYWKYSLAPAPDGGSCEHCGFREHIGGPMWAGELHNPEFVRALVETVEQADDEVYTTLPRIRGMVSTALNECTFASMSIPVAVAVPSKPVDPASSSSKEGPDLSTDVKHESSDLDTSRAELSPPLPITAQLQPPVPPYPPLPHPYFFLLPTRLSKTVHSVSPTQAALRGAILSLGYPVGRSHCRPNSIKTTAPWIVVWEVMRQWIERFAPIKEASLNNKGPGIRILKGIEGSGNVQEGKEGEGNSSNDTPWEHVRRKIGIVEFNEDLGKDEERVRGREVRYQMNPTANWGPMKAAKGGGIPQKKGKDGKGTVSAVVIQGGKSKWSNIHKDGNGGGQREEEHEGHKGDSGNGSGSGEREKSEKREVEGDDGNGDGGEGSLKRVKLDI